MTQQKLNFIYIFSKVFAVVVLAILFVAICYQFVVLSILKNEKAQAESNLIATQNEEKSSTEKLKYLKENYNEYLDDVAKDNLGLIKENQTLIGGV